MNRDHHLRNGFASRGLLPHVLSAILFGSAARGDARPKSDLDVMFVVDTEEAGDPVEDTAVDLQEELFAKLGVVLSPITLPLGRFRERYADGDPLLHNVEAEGRVLLGADVGELARPK